MQLKLTVAQLVAAGACSEAIARFQELYGEVGEVEWSLAKQIDVLKGPLGRYLGWAYCRQLIPLWSMASTNLSGADLRWADLRWADLRETNLSETNLSGAKVSGANLRWAKVSGADLSGANLSGADLSGANLSGADLRWADLRWADLRETNLSEANLSGAKASGAKVCLCDSDPCLRLREALAAAGWVPGADGLLDRAKTESEPSAAG